MQNKGEQAQALFEEGYNCAQSVAAAFAEEMGLSREEVLRLSSPFGGGMGRLREVCGAVSGMLLAAGMLYGYDTPADWQVKRDTYAMVQELAARFREKNGSIICRELLGLPEAEGSPDPTPRTETFYKERPCAALVRCAAELFEEWEREKASVTAGGEE